MRRDGAALWRITRADGGAPALFVGTLEAAVAHINARHLATGIMHAACEVAQ